MPLKNGAITSTWDTLPGSICHRANDRLSLWCVNFVAHRIAEQWISTHICSNLTVSLWGNSQTMLRYLLQTSFASAGCQCNPCTNDQGRTHICGLYRRFSMIFCQGDLDVMIPQQFPVSQVDLSLSRLPEHDVVPLLKEALTQRRFSALWQNPAICCYLRHWCILCGRHFHPAELVTHHWQVHPQESQWAALVRFQLIPCLLSMQTQDYQCMCCALIFNLSTESEQADMARQSNMQKHFSANCPVLHQIALLVQPLHGREHAADGPVRSGADGVLSGLESVDGPGTTVSKRKRRRAASKSGPNRPSCRQPARPAPCPRRTPRWPWLRCCASWHRSS